MPESIRIEGYTFGRIRINGCEYRNDVIVFPDRISSDWWRSRGHSLSMDDLSEVLRYSPDLLIVGRGASGIMRIPETTRKAILEKGIRLIDDTTQRAVQLFNQEMEAGSKTVGAFHLTC